MLVDGAPVGVPAGWASRPDLSATFPAAQYSGINTAVALYGLDTTTLADGVHTIAWVVTDNLGVSSGVGSRFFSVWNAGSAALTAASQAAAIAGAPEVDALAIDRTTIYARRGFDLNAGFTEMRADDEGRFGITGEELDRFEVQLDPGGGYDGYLRTPNGLWPLPIGSHFEPSTNVFTWQPSAGFVGRYQFVFVRGSAPSARREIDIVLLPKGTLSGPRVVIDTPVADQRVGHAIFVSGWAVDGRATAGSGIDAVHVWAYPADGGAPIFAGSAMVGGARPDVADVYGPAARDSGYGTIVRNLAPGRYMLAVFGHSTVTRDFLPAATVSITVR